MELKTQDYAAMLQITLLAECCSMIADKSVYSTELSLGPRLFGFTHFMDMAILYLSHEINIVSEEL